MKFLRSQGSFVAVIAGIAAFLFVGIIPGTFIDASNAYLDYDALVAVNTKLPQNIEKQNRNRAQLIAGEDLIGEGRLLQHVRCISSLEHLFRLSLGKVSNSVTDTEVKLSKAMFSAFVQHPAPSRSSNADKPRIGKLGESFL